jgi:hypothetical protein
VDPRARCLLEGLGHLKNPMTIGTRTRDLPACSIVPQTRYCSEPTVLIRMNVFFTNIIFVSVNVIMQLAANILCLCSSLVCHAADVLSY